MPSCTSLEQMQDALKLYKTLRDDKTPLQGAVLQEEDERAMDQPEYSVGQMMDSIFGLHEIVDIYRDDDEQWVYKTLDGAEIPESEVRDVQEEIWTVADQAREDAKAGKVINILDMIDKTPFSE